MLPNENDENSVINNTRLTRAKAAQGGDEQSSLAKKPLQTKRTTNTLNATQRRRALGDVTNAAKGVEMVQEGKKAVSKVNTSEKKIVQTTTTQGIQKLTRTNSSRSALGPRDANAKAKPAQDLKKPTTSSGSSANAQKKRTHTSSSSTAVDEFSAESEVEVADVKEPPAKKSFTQDALNRRNSLTHSEQEMEDDMDKIVEALDADDLDDPSMCAEYVREIFQYYRQLEKTTLPNPNYMEHQDELEWKMRGILVDWLIEVHTRFRLLPETLFLTINIVDRFLSQKVVPLDKLQLVGITAMFIASKYEEVLSPHVGNFVHVADDGFSVEEVLCAERYTLDTLKYDLSYPNPMNFLRRISKADNYDIQTRTFGKYFLEVALVDHRFMKYTQSHVAAASMYLARVILDKDPWVCFIIVLLSLRMGF